MIGGRLFFNGNPWPYDSGTFSVPRITANGGHPSATRHVLPMDEALDMLWRNPLHAIGSVDPNALAMAQARNPNVLDPWAGKLAAPPEELAGQEFDQQLAPDWLNREVLSRQRSIDRDPFNLGTLADLASAFGFNYGEAARYAR